MDQYLISDVYKTAGQAITDRLLAIMPEEQVIQWFYQPVQVLDNKKPCDLCGTEEQHMLEQIISEFESGTFSF
jgi:uncharacterized protein (DUF2384 family)